MLPPLPLPQELYVSVKHEGDKVIAFDHGTAAGPLLFVFNFHPSASYTGYRIGVPARGSWRLVLDSDAEEFGGHRRVDASTTHEAQEFEWQGRPFSLQLYLPCRTAQVYHLTPAT